MATNVNVYITGFQATGQNVNFPQYEVDITINWKTNNGEDRTHTETVLFPNILNHASISNAWRKEKLEALILAALREIQGVDNS